MREKWDSDSLRWIHEVREENYLRTRDKTLRAMSPSPSAAARTLLRRLGLRRVPLRRDEQLIRAGRRRPPKSRVPR